MLWYLYLLLKLLFHDILKMICHIDLKFGSINFPKQRKQLTTVLARLNYPCQFLDQTVWTFCEIYYTFVLLIWSLVLRFQIPSPWILGPGSQVQSPGVPKQISDPICWIYKINCFYKSIRNICIVIIGTFFLANCFSQLFFKNMINRSCSLISHSVWPCYYCSRECERQNSKYFLL